MLAVAGTGELPAGPDWAFEFKWDGVRAIVDTRGGNLRVTGDVEEEPGEPARGLGRERLAVRFATHAGEDGPAFTVECQGAGLADARRGTGHEEGSWHGSNLPMGGRATGDGRRGTGDRGQGTGDGGRGTGHGARGTEHRSRVAGIEWPLARHPSPVARRLSPVAC